MIHLAKLKELTTIIKDREKTEGFNPPGISSLIKERVDIIELANKELSDNFLNMFSNSVWTVETDYSLTVNEIPDVFIDACSNFGSLENVKADIINHTFFINAACVRVTRIKQFKNVTINFSDSKFLSDFIKTHNLKCNVTKLREYANELTHKLSTNAEIILLCL